jgi:hypothetical protein
MELLEFIKSMSPEDLDDFAFGVGTTVPHLRNVAYKARVASAALAAQIQVLSQGKVQVSTLRPKDWHLVWGKAVNQTMNWGGIVADERQRRFVMNVADACHATVHESPGGAESLGPRLGKRGTSLSAEVQPRSAVEVAAMQEAGRTVPKFGVLDAVKVMRFTADRRILNAMAVELGCMVVRLPDLDVDAVPAAAKVAQVAQGFSDLMTKVVKSLDDNKVTDNELDEVERQAGVLVATTQQLLASLGRMNAALHGAASSGGVA